MGRHVGINVPLFSLRSRTGWGIGELPDLARFTGWLQRARLDRVLLLPLGTMPRGQTSPYSAVSTLGIDPIFISMDDVSDFERAGGAARLAPESRDAIEVARRSPSIRHELVTRAKEDALRLAFRAFLTYEWEQLTPRASDLAGYIARERFWLDDYALFLALSEAHGWRFWRDWPAGVRDRDPRALDDARRQLKREVLEHQYRQWIAEGQWQSVRQAARARGVAIYGDLPFVAAADSPEIWAHADEFDLDVSVGVPPDAFSPTGQDWGLPLYRWDVIRESGYRWLRQRGQRMTALYDGLRVDHVVGVYRTYARRTDGVAFFSPADEAEQREQGAAVLGALAENGLSLLAEDLGVIPDFVRESLRQHGYPGCRVLRWERDWHAAGAPYIEPATFPPVSAAMTGTHDTEPMSVWWEALGREERRAVLKLHGLAAVAGRGPEQAWSNDLRDAFLSVAYASGSRDLFVPLQDVFGWTDRVNVPGTVGPENWTWALPWPVDDMLEHPAACERAAFLDRLAIASDRASRASHPPATPGAHDASGQVR